LRHDWTHPAFANESKAAAQETRNVEASVKWLKDFATMTRRDYEDFLEMASELEESNSAFGGNDRQADDLNDNKKDFIYHLGIVTGKKFGNPETAYFSCAC
jgi:hypothetical protein